RISAANPSMNGVGIAKSEGAPSSALARACVSSTEAATRAAPWRARSLAGGESGLRVTARTGGPRASRLLPTAPPCLPVAPTTTTSSFLAIIHSFPASMRSLHARVVARNLVGGVMQGLLSPTSLRRRETPVSSPGDEHEEIVGGRRAAG